MISGHKSAGTNGTLKLTVPIVISVYTHLNWKQSIWPAHGRILKTTQKQNWIAQQKTVFRLLAVAS